MVGNPSDGVPLRTPTPPGAEVSSARAMSVRSDDRMMSLAREP